MTQALPPRLTGAITVNPKLTARPSPRFARRPARLLNLAASLVRYALTVRESEGEGSLVTFKAGDVAVGTDANARLKRALDEKNLRYEAALPLLKDSGFCFMQVRI